MDELAGGVSGLTLRDIRGDRNSRAAKLCRQPESLVRRKTLAYEVDRLYKVDAFAPDEQISITAHFPVTHGVLHYPLSAVPNAVGYHSVDLRGDYVIVGSGIAGLRAAVELSPAGTIVIITKADPSESNTEYAQGGIAAAIGPDDSPALHAGDTVMAGDGLCDENAVRVLAEEGPRYTLELLDWGARFDLDANGRPALASEGAHSLRRVLHASDATGREIGRVLWEKTIAQTRIRVLKNTLAVEALVEDD